MSVSVILLAGGSGSRMGSSIPKQFLTLKGKPYAFYSFETFQQIREVHEIVVVCPENFQEMFSHNRRLKIKFALPGLRRQDSLWNGFLQISSSSEFVCVHDAARPFVDAETILKLFGEAQKFGASVCGVPAKSTTKEVNEEGFVVRTLDRSKLWEIQTPQVIKSELLEKGFRRANEKNLSVTDDVSFVELLGEPVKLVQGSYDNIKITTPEDLLLAEVLAEKFYATI